MRLEQADRRIIHVFLSERNLRSLLVKLQGFPANSTCTIEYQTKDGTILVVTAELDSVHYANPERDGQYIGEMHPETESQLDKRQ